jgi:ubiquinone/menaquinone biosynthesis C-methylase UbiE
LYRRQGGLEVSESAAKQLNRMRERVVAGASLREGDVLLDVGCGDGLIGFGAFEILGPAGSVIFSDISSDLHDRCRDTAVAVGVLPRCQFVLAGATDLRPVASSSVDAVTTRSVLIYVAEKPAAFDEFHRVLRPGGLRVRMSTAGQLGLCIAAWVGRIGLNLHLFPKVGNWSEVITRVLVWRL